MKPSMKISLVLGAVAGLLAGTAQSAGPLQSEYTDLTSPTCKEVKMEKQIPEDDSFAMKCPGIGGYKLEVVGGDLRTSVNVIDPSGKSFPLNFYDTITGHFSTLGNKAEWLGEKKGAPSALIVRVNASENVDKPSEITSYLAVAKITSSEICVTDKVVPSPKMNEVARMAAAGSATKACLKSIYK